MFVHLHEFALIPITACYTKTRCVGKVRCRGTLESLSGAENWRGTDGFFGWGLDFGSFGSYTCGCFSLGVKCMEAFVVRAPRENYIGKSGGPRAWPL